MEADNYDEYYSIENKVVKCFRQEFVKDPYMKLKPIPQIRLISFDQELNQSKLEKIFDLDNTPIITRTKVDLEGFKNIESNLYLSSSLIPIQIDLSSLPNYPSCGFIHQMNEEDLSFIEELFRNQYSLRYKMVNPMFTECPEACFTFRLNNQILGVSFNQIKDLELYMHQIFVDETHRGKHIGENLYQYRLNLARKISLKTASANIRKEVFPFHERFNAKEIEEKLNEKYVIRI